jgi:hypothetical protein
MIIWSAVNWVEEMRYAFAYMLELVETGVSGNVGALIHAYCPFWCIEDACISYKSILQR